MSKVTDRIVILLALVVVAQLGYFSLRPGGPLRAIAGRVIRVGTVGGLWPELIQVGSRMGNDTAQVELVEFFDYECPYCRIFHATLERVLAEGPQVGVVFRHFPLAKHRNARPAAIAAICAEKFGRFQEFHSLLLRTDDWLDDPDWVELAVRVGELPVHPFEQCLRSAEAEQRLEKDVALARRLGLHSTPTLVFRKEHAVVPGAIAEARLRRMVGF